MSKYRIVKHRAGDSTGYCPEVLECTISIGGVKESWRRLAGNENLTSLDLWVRSLPETIEEAKSIIEKHIEDQKPKYSEEIIYEYDTEKKEQQSTEEKTTAVEWLGKQLISEGIYVPFGMYEQAKQMEEEQKYETSAFWFGRGVLAGKENRIEELKPIKK